MRVWPAGRPALTPLHTSLGFPHTITAILHCRSPLTTRRSPPSSAVMPKHYRLPGKKKEGNAAKYITRSQAVKYLQVNLSVFRKLCILKGIFPREPKKKVKGNHHTYYHVKDILFLKHEPMLETLRDIRAYEKKVKKAGTKKNWDLVERLNKQEPTYSLDRLVKERYPTFIDALRDLDDCLSMVHLFAALPAVEREHIQVGQIHKCRRLSHEWQAYISRTHKLRKTFLSVKGIYYQAEVQGQTITWLTPHALQQVLPTDVDYNIMLTFLEFYETLLGFVNFKLYQSINMKYLPIIDSRLEALAADLYALSRYFDANARASVVESIDVSSSEESELKLAQLQHHLPTNELGALMNLVEDVGEKDEDDAETKECRNFFKDMKFFLSREVPRESLLFVIPAFGGVVSWEGEGAPFPESDQSITHQIVDRTTQSRKFLSREYVQPQWIYDCVNFRVILPIDEYLVGRVPPPHLSPFVDNEAEGHVPEYAEAIKRAEEIEAAEKKWETAILQKQDLDELKMELEGYNYYDRQNVSKQKDAEGTDADADSDASKKKDVEGTDADEVPLPDLKQIAEDADNMSKVLISRRNRKLLEAMEFGNQSKRARVELLKEREKKIDEAEKSR
ncbi:pescadillo-related [Abeliophyllum distichum]|uniref:Pescadillo homolog n=1 Tax=Abeliophyllum distichum TaxID=126358 RepID=A0ABD1SGH0_9LAMI